MDQNRWQQIGTIVDEALSLDTPEERTALIKELCGGDATLKKEVIDWLDSIANSEGLWDSLLLSNRVLMDDMTLGGAPALSDSPEELPEKIGRYNINERLGRGGMGDVFLAERSEGDFHGKVALKVIRNEVGSTEQVRRFLQERTLLSRLNHPHIARLLDGGVSGDGRPYYVMEYVDGIPITEYCRQRNCSLNERLELFGQVCRAVQYAHANFIVHRDLKPDNLLVTPEGTVKILDFGIAKLLDQELSEHILLQTRAGQRLLSLHYAAPEQITMEPVTAATDVYALGLLLYELATGTRPFDLKGKNLLQAEQIIRNREPIKPSIAAAKWQSKLTGDLDAIIGKALRKEPEQRYESPSRLWEDIESYLASRPVQARKGTLRYRAAKFARRNKAVLVATALFLIAAIGFGSYHVYQLNEEREVAELEAAKAEQVTQYMVELFGSADPTENVSDTLNVYDLLNRGKHRVDELDEQPELQIDFLLALGHSFQKIGAYEEAERLFIKADSLSGLHHPPKSFKVANTALFLGNLYNEQRNFESAKKNYRKAERIFKKLQNEYWQKASYTYSGLGNTLQELGEVDSAEILIQKALKLKEENDADRKEILSTKLNLAKIQRVQENYQEAEEIYREILSELDLRETPNNTLHPLTLNNLAYLLRIQERYEEAEPFYRRALELHNLIYGEDHPTSLMILNNLAGVTWFQGKLHETEAILKQNLKLTQQKYGNHLRTGAATSSLGSFHFQNKDFEAASNYYKKATEIYKSVLGERHTRTSLSMLWNYFSRINTSIKYSSDFLFINGYGILELNQPNYTHNDIIRIEQLIERVEKHCIGDCSKEVNQLKKLVAK